MHAAKALAKSWRSTLGDTGVAIEASQGGRATAFGGRFLRVETMRFPMVIAFRAENRRAVCPESQCEPRAYAILWSERRWPMRAYVTAVGLMLGLVAVWAALVSFVA
jgi:hypothetical protein